MRGTTILNILRKGKELNLHLIRTYQAKDN